MPTLKNLDRLAALARRRFGVVTAGQLNEIGIGRKAIDGLCARGLLIRRERGIYALTVAPDSRESRWLVALEAAGPRAALSHRTAATLHGLEHRLPLDEIHILAPRQSRRRVVGQVHHECRHLDPTEVTRHGPFRLTTVPRTLCDLAGELGDGPQLRRLVAAAVRSGSADAPRLRAAIERRGRFPGRAALRSIVDELSPLVAQAREELEARFLSLTTSAGLAPTALNHRVVDAAGSTRYLDAVWLPERVYAELDSRRFHGTLLDWHDDLRRENAIAIAGWKLCLRFSWWDIVEHPDEVIGTLTAALASVRDDAKRAVGQ